MSRVTDYTIRKRYISTQLATDKQNGLIKKMYYNMGMMDRASKDYKHLNHYQAHSLIKALKEMARNKKRKKK